MLARLWLKGLLSRLSGRLLGGVAGVMLTVALLASIGSFVGSSTAVMTRRAIAAVPVDWQVGLAPGADVHAVIAAVGQATPYTALQQVGYASVNGFTAATQGTVQTTGAGKALGLGPEYRAQFPAEVRQLIGPPYGVRVAQQTAANLHVTIGDAVSVQRVGLPPATVTVAGIVDLPHADALFQVPGVPAGTAPQAPPENVLILPLDQWHALFDPQAAVRPESVRTQLHVRIAHALPPDPASALATVEARAHHLEALIAGGGTVADNLAGRLLQVRADALYATVLFVFLGLPGAILAVLLTFAVAGSGRDRRRLEQALLRTRGATTAQILRLESLEALIIGVGGVILGLGVSAAAGRAVGPADIPAAWTALPWAAGAALVGLLLALAAVLYPAWVQVRHSTVAAGRVVIRRGGTPLWQQVYLDVIFLAVSAVTFWQIAGSGYQVVVTPEGVPQSFVAYQAFVAPICLWLGAALLIMRLWTGGLARGRQFLTRLLRPLVPELAGVVAASLERQRVLVTRGLVLAAIAFSFAVSTAVFNSTYNAQSRVDAQLTNGADVTVTTAASGAALNGMIGPLGKTPGVMAAEPMQHRFAYVGNDLQDLYGIDPGRIGRATSMSNAYFASGNARATLAALAARPDGVLVSAETATAYQLKRGDLLNLRLQNAGDHQYHVVPFHFVDVVREFPTAPKDSFLIANARYLTQQTGSDAVDIVLLRTSGQPSEAAARARVLTGLVPGVSVTDIGSTQQAISSNLTAVNLRGLTQLELSFAVLLVAGATGLVMALGLAERRRTFAILAAMGARQNQLASFFWSEAVMILAGGGALGIGLGFAVAEMLVKLLTGVFDPPPQFLSVPWAYLGVLTVAAIVSTGLAVSGAAVASRRSIVEAVRNL